MTIINQKSISGITSITFASAGDDLLTFHSNNGTERFRIDNSGNTKITAGIVTTLTTTGNATVGGTLGVTGETTFSTHVNLGDSDQLRFGASNDLVIQHNGSDSLISETGTGDLYIRGSNNIYLQKGDGSETFIATNDDGAVELYHDNVKKIDTVSGGRRIFGYLSMQGTGGHIYLPDSAELKLGDSEDLKIYHNGSHSYIADEGTGELIISGSRIQLMNAARGEKAIDFVQDGAVDIYYDGSKKFETKSDGVDINGELQCDSLDVDGAAVVDGKVTLGASHTGGEIFKLGKTSGTSYATFHNGGTAVGFIGYADQLVTGGASDEFAIRSEDDLLFAVGGNTERVRITSNGLTFNGDTAAANALEDYEEGTFNPVLEGSSTAGSPTYGNREGAYTKVGRLVTCFINIAITNKGGMAGDVRISGLPFNVDNVIAGTGVDGGGFVNYYQNIADSAITGFGLLPDQSTDNATFYFQKTGVSMGGLEPADINSTFNFRAVVIYCNG